MNQCVPVTFSFLSVQSKLSAHTVSGVFMFMRDTLSTTKMTPLCGCFAQQADNTKQS